MGRAGTISGLKVAGGEINAPVHFLVIAASSLLLLLLSLLLSLSLLLLINLREMNQAAVQRAAIFPSNATTLMDIME